MTAHPHRRKPFKPVPMNQEDKLRVALSRFAASPKAAADYEALLIAGSRVYAQGVGLSYEAVHKIVAEVIGPRGETADAVA